MKFLHFNLPDFNLHNLNFTKIDLVNHVSGNFKSGARSNKLRGYNEYNALIYQTFDLDESYKKFAKTLFDTFTLSVIKQIPGSTNPMHTDSFYQFSKMQKIDPNECVRLNVFLEDWKNGHYFEIMNQPVTKWKKGDAVMIEYQEQHLAGNMGNVNRYTLQITGIKEQLKIQR